MSGALREIVARYSTVVDDRPLTALERKIDRLKDQVRSFGQWAAAASIAVGAAGYTMVQAASKAEENLNVLSVTFGKNTDAVLRWSKESSAAMGRSEYSMQEYAGSFGSFLDPVFKGTGKDITKMSQELAELSVDLASFYNTSDEEAKMRLFSGMSGETEAVRRLGINIADARLSELNKEINGEKVKYKYLDLTAKTELRMEAIRRDTYAKQGDAARTAGSWANSLKRVQEKFKTLQVTLGKKLLPLAKDLLSYAEGFANSLTDAADMLGRHVGTFKTVALFSAAAAVSWGALEIILRKCAAQAVIFASAFLVIDDLVHFLSGNDSIFGSLITWLTDAKAPLVWFENKMARIAETMIQLGKIAMGDDAAINYFRQSGSFTPLADQSEQAQADSRVQGRKNAVVSGDYAMFESSMEPDASKGAKKRAYAQFLKERQKFLEANPAEYTATDRASGLAPRSVPKGASFEVESAAQLAQAENARARAPKTAPGAATPPEDAKAATQAQAQASYAATRRTGVEMTVDSHDTIQITVTGKDAQDAADKIQSALKEKKNKSWVDEIGGMIGSAMGGE